MIRHLALLLVFAFPFAACNMLEKKDTSTEIKKKKKIADEDEESPKKKKSAVINDDIETNSKAEILNKIIVHESGGLKVSRAFLSFEDGSLVPRNNRTELAKPVYLNLVSKGWKAEDGMVSIDASEKIVSDGGEVVLNATNLFKATPTIKEENTKNIYLKASITKTRKDINYFIISYRVWDKRGEGEIKGSYMLYIDDTKQ